MQIVIAGGSGFLGTALVERFRQRGDEAVVLSRHSGAGLLQWDPASRSGEWVQAVASADVVINLAGANIGEKRWTAKRKVELVESRLRSTAALVDAMRTAVRPRVFVSASGVGFYGPRGDEVLDETTPAGSDFIAGLVTRWESAALAAKGVARVVVLRFGVVLSNEGGALPRMLLPFRFFVGGPVGSGRQYLSWISLVDVLRGIEWAIDNPSAAGVYNMTAPNPVTSREFARTVGRVLHRPSLFPTPALPLKLLFGELAGSLLLTGQRVVPRRALAEEFRFVEGELETALRRALKPGTETN